MPAKKRKLIDEVVPPVAVDVPAIDMSGLTARDQLAVNLLLLSVQQTGKIHYDVVENIVKVADTMAERLGWA